MSADINPKLPTALQMEKDLRSRSEEYWIRKGQENALRLFRLAARRVPAYKDFLKRNRIAPEKIRTIADLSHVPPVHKKNYLRAYPLEKLCWDGNLAALDMVSVSSGSTGQASYWPRADYQDMEAALTHEMFLRDSFGIHKHKTLLIVSFAMGMWVAGTLTYRVTQEVAKRYGMTVITPGIDMKEVLKIIQALGDKYEQIIIAGYPPFVKDAIDNGTKQGIRWKNHRIKFLFAAESFSETWRDHVCRQVGAKEPLKDSLNIFGTADALILAHETPLSILARRIATKKPNLYADIFAHLERVPTLAQYNPALRFFQNEKDQLIFSAYSGIPLVRYAIGDSGGIIPFGDMEFMFKKYGEDLQARARQHDISAWKLPFVYVLGRSDFTATLYGLNIYPETVRAALERHPLNRHTTGKFTMITKNDARMDQYLELNVELQPGVGPDKTLTAKITKEVTRTLREKNREYDELSRSLGGRAEPKLILYPFGDSTHFTPGGKQKWLKKEV